MTAKATIALVLICALAPLASAQQAPFAGKVTVVKAPASSLDTFIRERMKTALATSHAAWIGYSIHVREKFQGVRSSSGRNGSWSGLSINGWQIGREGSGIVRDGAADKALLIQYAQKDGGARISSVTIAEFNEPLRFTMPLIWISDIGNERSLDLLQLLMRDPVGIHEREDLAIAIALHDGERPLTMLKEMLFSVDDPDARESILTWLGLALMPERQKEIFALENRLTDPDLRESLTFLYHNAGTREATERLFYLARHDAKEDVREQALFWLGQKARTQINGANDHLDSDQKSALFALRQRDSAESRQALLKVAKSGKTPELRSSALFWLCQEGDPIVIDFLEELLLGKTARR